jgi:hypothetical protein
MTICPIALAVGCEKCPAFSFCPLTTVLGDQQKEDEVDASPMTSAHDRDWSKAISQKEIPLTSDHPDFLSTNRSTEDEYQRYAEEELEKNTKQMESFKGEDAEVIPERNKMEKEESGKE